MYVDENKNGEYFDSYGRAPQEHFANFLRKNTVKYKWNTRQIQGVTTSTCGQYSVYFLIARCRDRSILSHFEDKNFDFNDQLVVKFVNSYFNTNTKVIDLKPFLGNARQMCRCEKDCSFCFKL